MKANDDQNRKYCFMVPFSSMSRAILLTEVARSRGLECWIEEGNRIEVNIYATEEHTEAACEIAEKGEELLRFYNLESLALTVQGLGEKPSPKLMEALAIEKRKVGISGKVKNLPDRLDHNRLNGLN